METAVMEVAGLNDKVKHIVCYKGKPLIHCGKKQIPFIMQIMKNGTITHEVPMEVDKQIFVLKLMKEVDKELQNEPH